MQVFDSITGLVARNKRVVCLLLSGTFVCIYLALCTVNVYTALTMSVTCAAFYLFYKNIDSSFLLFILILPLGYAPFFDRLPLGMSAIKIQLILSAIYVVLFVLYKKPYKINTRLKVLFVILIAIFCAAWIRSMDYALVLFSGNIAGKLSVFRYLLDYVSWTFTAFLPLIIIVYYFGDRMGIERIIRAVAISIVALVGYLFCIYMFQVSDKSNFEVIRAELANFSGLHGNDLANFCILSFPLILAWAIHKKSKFACFTLFAIVAGTAISFSRTAYFLLLFGFFLFLFLSGRRIWIPITAVIIGAAVFLLVPDMVIDRAVTGLDTGNYDEISAGRIEMIWQPILNELENKPELILFGSGRYGFTNTDAWKQGSVPPVLHAHNMYLDCVLDVGITGLAVFLSFFIAILIHFGKNAVKYRRDLPYRANLLNGCMVSVICYLISGFTGRSFFPGISNGYLWIIIGLGIVLSSQGRREGWKDLLS